MEKFKNNSDQELISALQAGNTAAGEEIYSRYHSKVVGICCHYLHSLEDGEDAAQEVFFKILVLKKIFDFRGESSFWTWLRRVVINVCKETIRRFARIQEVCLKSLDQDMSPLEEIVPSRGLNPEEQYFQQQEHAYIRIVVKQLPKKYYEAIAVVYLDDMSYAEAANRLNLTTQSLGVRLLRGRRMLNNLCRKNHTVYKDRTECSPLVHSAALTCAA